MHNLGRGIFSSCRGRGRGRSCLNRTTVLVCFGSYGQGGNGREVHFADGRNTSVFCFITPFWLTCNCTVVIGTAGGFTRPNERRSNVSIRDSVVARPLHLQALVLQPLRRTYLYIARGSNDTVPHTAYERIHSILHEIRTSLVSSSMIVFSIIVCNVTIV
jgi:hypothetical protein